MVTAQLVISIILVLEKPARITEFHILFQKLPSFAQLSTGVPHNFS
jgi:hypothetical protein